jgi:Ca-activated chloride channel homolog
LPRKIFKEEYPMNARNFATVFTFITLLAVLLSACATAATPAPAPIAAAPQTAPKQPPAQQPATKNYPPAPAPTSAPMAAAAPTRAPAAAQLPAAPPPVDNYFQNYGVNPFVDTVEDHLSTFGLDVDTASYTVARRYVMDGNLPPSDSVRVEEFVNYFYQGYPTPQDIAFGIYADGAPSPFHYDGTYILRFGIQGYQVPESDRKPASLTFVIDTSGSMSMENRLMMVKQSLQLLVDRLRPTDTVAIVQYGSEARVVLNPTSGEDRTRILDAIYSLETSGATNAEGGLRLGYQLANQAYRPNATNRVILCSDGVANVGATGPDQILESIRGYAASGITLTTVGFGMGNFNDVLMERLADGGNGNYAYVDNMDEARRLFVDNLTSTLQTIAMNAKVQVDFNPDIVARYRLIGYENRAIADENFRNDSVDAGEIGAGHSATALYAVQLKPQATGRIATVQLRWEDPQAHTIQEINGNFNTWDLASSFENASARYQLAVTVAQYAEVLRGSPWADGTSINQILDHAVRLGGLLPEDQQVTEFVSLVSRAAQIQALMR